MVAHPARARSVAYPHLIRRTVGCRLPRGSLVVDVAWHPGSPLRWFVDDYRTVAVMADAAQVDPSSATGGSGPAVVAPTIRADIGHLGLADASVDCVLLLAPVGGVVFGPGTLSEARRVLRPGGLVVVGATSTRGRPVGHDARFPRLREAIGSAVTALTELGLAPEQITHLQPVLSPMSIVSRIQVRARSGRPLESPGQTGVPLVCRVVAAVNQLAPARAGQPRRPRVSSVLVFGRKP